MDRFHDGQHVRLRSRAHGTYLHARGDGRSVSLRRRRASVKQAWTVHIHQGDVPYLLLHSVAYGRYLAANGFGRAEQRHYDEPEEVLQSIMWQAFETGIGDDVVLRNVGGRYLRANRRYLRWNTGGVSVEDTDNAGTMMCWTVEHIPAREAGMPDLPAPPNQFLYTVLGQAWRLIEFVRANAEGLYDEDDWHMFALRGRYVNHLRNELVDRIAFMDGQEPDGIAMCIQAGRYGRLTPLVVDLPRYTGGPAETHQIVVMMSGTPAYDELRYPDVNAI